MARKDIPMADCAFAMPFAHNIKCALPRSHCHHNPPFHLCRTELREPFRQFARHTETRHRMARRQSAPLDVQTIPTKTEQHRQGNHCMWRKWRRLAVAGHRCSMRSGERQRDERPHKTLASTQFALRIRHDPKPRRAWN